MTPSPETGTFSVPLPCRYLLDARELRDRPLLIVTLHGYGATPEAMLRLTLPAVGAGHVIAALEGPFPHYAALTPTSGIGFGWGITKYHGDAIRVHHDMLLATLSRLRKRFSIPKSRSVLMGFSQSVGLNYRFIGTYPDEAGGVIGLCGGVPRDWEEDKYRTVEAPILHISRDQDEFFPAETAMAFPERLRRHARNVEFHMLPGAHRFPSKGAKIIQPWLAKLAGDTIVSS